MDSDVFDSVLATVRRFVREQVVPREAEIEETDERFYRDARLSRIYEGTSQAQVVIGRALLKEAQ